MRRATTLIDKPTQWGKWWVPPPHEVCTDGEWVRWPFGRLCREEHTVAGSFRSAEIEESDRGRERWEVSLVFREFLALEDKTAADVVAFIKHHGALYLCDHGRVMTHRWGAGAVPTDELRRASFVHCFPESDRFEPGADGHPVEWVREPVRGYQHYAREAASLCRIAGALKAGYPVSPEWWSALGGPPPPQNARWQMVSQHVNVWLEDSGPTLRVNSSSNRAPQFNFGGGHLFSFLAFQLAMEITGVRALATCHWCRQFYSPSRWPRAGERSFCGQCGVKAGPRARSSAYRRKRRRHAET